MAGWLLFVGYVGELLLVLLLAAFHDEIVDFFAMFRRARDDLIFRFAL